MLSFLQVAGNFDSANPGNWGMMRYYGGNFPMMGWAWPLVCLMIIVWLVMIIVGILSLINLYHWGMTDKAIFDKNKEDKKMWYKKIVLLPIISAVVCIIPFLGWILALIGYVYWIVVNCQYFFVLKKKLV